MTAAAAPVPPAPDVPAPLDPPGAAEATALLVGGELDAAGADVLRALLADEVRPGRTLVLDLSGVEHLSSAALAVLIGAHRRLRDGGGSLVISDPSPTVTRVLRVSGLHRVIPVV